MVNKTKKQFLFETNLVWRSKNEGEVSVKNTKNTIVVDTPVEFGGSGKAWSSEQLLLSSVASSFMATFIAFAQKYNFCFSGIECSTIGQVEIVEGKYKFTNINVYPKIRITEEDHRDKAFTIVEKTHHNCLISNSLHANMIYHTEVVWENADQT